MTTQKLDGNRMRDVIVDDIKKHIVAHPQISYTLGIFAVEPNAETKRYIQKKQELGTHIGVRVVVRDYGENLLDTASAINELTQFQKECDGVIVQLPLPSRFDAKSIIDSIAPEKDIDALSSESLYVSPVAHAIRHMLKKAHVWDELKSKHCVVVGAGETVGKPVIGLVRSAGVLPTILTKDTPEDLFRESLKQADVVVSGVGVAGLIKPEYLTEGVVLIDAGFSFKDGIVSGDIDRTCFEKASFYSTVPGGVGPLAIAFLFQNLLSTK